MTISATSFRGCNRFSPLLIIFDDSSWSLDLCRQLSSFRWLFASLSKWKWFVSALRWALSLLERLLVLRQNHGNKPFIRGGDFMMRKAKRFDCGWSGMNRHLGDGWYPLCWNYGVLNGEGCLKGQIHPKVWYGFSKGAFYSCLRKCRLPKYVPLSKRTHPQEAYNQRYRINWCQFTIV